MGSLYHTLRLRLHHTAPAGAIPFVRKRFEFSLRVELRRLRPGFPLPSATLTHVGRKQNAFDSSSPS
jgi:hypothetical protein